MHRINLLPPQERRKASRERGLMYALLFLIVVVAALGALYVFKSNSLSNAKQQLSSAQSELNVINAKIAALAPYKNMQAQDRDMRQAASQIYDSRITWSSILDEISLLIPDNVSLTTLTAAVPAPMLAGSQLAGGGSAGSSGSSGAADITFAGQALSHKDVADFMTRLGLMPQLMNIQLVSSQEGSGSGSSSSSASTTTPLVTFQITAQLRPFVVKPPLAVPGATTTALTGTGGGQ
jgi:Tfp pilus assembly protein PilN